MYFVSLLTIIPKANLLWMLCILTPTRQHFCTSGRIKINPLCKHSLEETCVEIRDCPYFIQLLDKSRIPRPRNVIRAIRERHCGFLGSIPKVCCSTDELSSTLLNSSTTKINSLNAVDKTTMNILRTHKNRALLPQMNCGIFLPTYRIMSGIHTAVGEFPWMALIASNTDENGLDFRCAATLINDRYVLTAAHCVTDVTIISVRLGEHDVNVDMDCNYNMKCSEPVRDIKIEHVVIHPNYFAKNFANDIALIRLAGKVNFTGFRSPKLLKTLVPIVPNEECATIYEQHADISMESQLCAGGYRGRDSCGGDSGGPLKHVAPISLEYEMEGKNPLKFPMMRYVQFGIVSYGPRHCGINGQPGVYTKITYYIDWILDNLKS